MTRPTTVPDLSERPFTLTVERAMKASPSVLYWAWTDGFSRWFAAPGSVLMTPEVNNPYFFEVEAGRQRHPHYGRLLRLEPDHLVELTWVTGEGGTGGAETIVTVELAPRGSETLLRLTHAGFATEAARDEHEEAWLMVLAQLDERMSPDGTECRDEEAEPARMRVSSSSGGVMEQEREPVVTTGMLIRRPVAEVFEALADPAVTSRFWFTHGSGRLEPGAHVRWDWEMYGVSAHVTVRTFEPNARILMDWGSAEEPTTTVDWAFTPHGDGATFVSVTNSGFRGDGDGIVAQAIDAMGGFTLVLAGAKALLEHGIELNLVPDRYPAGYAGTATAQEGNPA